MSAADAPERKKERAPRCNGGEVRSGGGSGGSVGGGGSSVVLDFYVMLLDMS